MNILSRIRDFFGARSYHLSNEEGAGDRPSEVQIEPDCDDNQTMLPFFRPDTPAAIDRNASSLNCEPINWNKWLTVVTGALAIATFIVALFSWIGSKDTHQLVITARDTEEQQLRAYVNTNGFDYRCPDCDDPHNWLPVVETGTPAVPMQLFLQVIVEI